MSDPESALEYVDQIRDIQTEHHLGAFGMRAISIFSTYVKRKLQSSDDEEEEEETTISDRGFINVTDVDMDEQNPENAQDEEAKGSATNETYEEGKATDGQTEFDIEDMEEHRRQRSNDGSI